VTDYFSLLNEPRRPWLDTEQLKARFISLSAECHPDRATTPGERAAATTRFTELNAAHNCLRDPRERLHHLLALEGQSDARQVRSVPPAVAELVLPAEQLCREVTAFLGEQAKATSPLVQAQQFERALDWQERVAAMQQRLAGHRARLDETARALNAVWEQADSLPAHQRAAALPLAQLEELYRAYSYVTRFQQQLQERFVQLAL
jgi:DnaJ-domain-containing protein 1